MIVSSTHPSVLAQHLKVPPLSTEDTTFWLLEIKFFKFDHAPWMWALGRHDMLANFIGEWVNPLQIVNCHDGK